MLASSGNIYASGIVIDSDEILTTSPTVASSIKMSLCDLANEGRPEMARLVLRLLLFPVVGRYRNHLGTFSSSCRGRKHPIFAVEISMLSVSVMMPIEIDIRIYEAYAYSKSLTDAHNHPVKKR